MQVSAIRILAPQQAYHPKSPPLGPHGARISAFDVSRKKLREPKLIIKDEIPNQVSSQSQSARGRPHADTDTADDPARSSESEKGKGCRGQGQGEGEGQGQGEGG